MSFQHAVETRVLFLGEPHCGKRSLLHYYIFDQVVESEMEESELDTKKRTKPPPQNEFVKALHVDNKRIHAHFFVHDVTDMSFNEKEAGHQADCYVVLFDMGGWPETGNRARQLFNTITTHKKLMVGCKSDLFQKSRGRRTHCVPCSVLKNDNIDNVFDQITEILQFQDIALRTPTTPNTTTTPRRLDSDPAPRRSHNVKKLLRAVGKFRTTSHSNVAEMALQPGPVFHSHPLEEDASGGEELAVTTPRRPRALTFEGHSVDAEADVEDLTDTTADDFTYGDVDGEHEVPDDFLDHCEEKALLAPNNIVDSKQLLQAVWQQNVSALAQSLRALQQSGASFHVTDPVHASGDTLLHELVRKPGWLASLQVLLQSNVLSPNERAQLVNMKNAAGHTALHIVAARGLPEYVPLLLASGADVMVENERKMSALMIAIEMNQRPVVELLAHHSSELVRRPDAHGHTAFDVAIRLGYWDLAQLLHPHFPALPHTALQRQLEHEAHTLKRTFFQLVREEDTEQVFELVKAHPHTVTLTDDEGRTPLHIAVLGRHSSELPELLLARDADINQQDRAGNTPLHWAACHPTGHVFGRYLIECNARIDVANHEGNMPLHMAVFSGNRELTTYLLDECDLQGICIRHPNREENTPLHIACATPSSSPAHLDQLIALMVAKRAQTDALNSRRETPLHIAVAAGCPRIHPSLAEQLHARDVLGNTPLLAAARALNLAAVQSLLDLGAALDTANSDNESLLHLLASTPMDHLTEEDALQCLSLLKRLERKGAHKETIRQLLNRTTVSANETPLFYAVASQRVHLAKFYLRRGNAASANAQNIEGNTPLHLACQANARAMVDLLLRREALPTHANREGYTPLHYCAPPSHTALAERLLKRLKPSDLAAETSDGLTPLHLAAQAGNLSLVQRLVERTLRKDGSSGLLGRKTQHGNTALIYAMSNNHGKVASYLAKRQALERAENGTLADRLEFRKEPFPHIYPVVNHESVSEVQKLEIFSPTYNIYEGRLHEESILILEANSAASSVCMAHEVAVMSMIGDHPNIQRLYGACANKYCYLPYLPNCSPLDAILNELIIRRQTCDILQVLTIADGVANGMKCLHTATVSKPSILHNALSPRAILVDEQNAKIASFHAARVHFSPESALADKRELTLPSMDEVRYLAPEVVRGEPPSKKADVYSFGVILWQLCTTKMPYAHILMEDLVAVLRKDHTRPSLEGVSEGLRPLIAACWDSDPHARPEFPEICDRLNSLRVDNVQTLGRSRAMPSLQTKASPFPCCKPRDFQIMNKLRKRSRASKDTSAGAAEQTSLYLCTFERIVCVVKMWPPNQTQAVQSRCSWQMFAMKSLCECDHVVRYIYSDTDRNGNKCLFMEYMNQGTVAQVLGERKASSPTGPLFFSPSEILHYALPVALALKFMHKFTTVMVHRDIQADNVLITTRDDRELVKLGGFSSMHTLQDSEEHEVYRDIEGFALYLYQLLTLTTRVKNNWRPQVQKLQVPDEQQPFIGLLHSCLDPIERPTAIQLVERLEAIQRAL